MKVIKEMSNHHMNILAELQIKEDWFKLYKNG